MSAEILTFPAKRGGIASAIGDAAASTDLNDTINASYFAEDGAVVLVESDDQYLSLVELDRAAMRKLLAFWLLQEEGAQ